MASGDTMTINSSAQYYHDDDDDGDAHSPIPNDEDQHYHHPHNLSRLSMVSNNIMDSSNGEIDDANYYRDGDVGHDNHMGIYLSRLSIEGSDQGDDADEEFSDDEKERSRKGISSLVLLSSDSDKETGTLSLPATPPRHRRRKGLLVDDQRRSEKEYASENEAHRVGLRRNNGNQRRRLFRERWVEKSWEKKKNRYNNNNIGDEEKMVYQEQSNQDSIGGEQSECLVITRPKGGKRSLCMDMEEVRACRDLGFELEHERILEFPPRISISAACSTVDTASSGGNSPISNWRISSPGDDPRDVKARLKVWAQAVAFASSPHLTS